MKNQDGLTVINSAPLIPPEKIRGKTLDQMTLPERADLLREAYRLTDGEEVTDREMDIIGQLQTKVEEKVASWGVVVRKQQDAVEACRIEQEYYQMKADEAKARADRFQAKIDAMQEYIRLKMIEFNLKKIETPLLTVSLRKKPQKVEIIPGITPESMSHTKYVQTTISSKWDKNAIKEDIESVEFAKLSEPDFLISIKGA